MIFGWTLRLVPPLTCSCPAPPVQISEGAEVPAGGSGPVNKKQRTSPQHWARATGYPDSKGLQADPSPSWDKHNKKILYFLHATCVFYIQLLIKVNKFVFLKHSLDIKYKRVIRSKSKWNFIFSDLGWNKLVCGNILDMNWLSASATLISTQRLASWGQHFFLSAREKVASFQHTGMDRDRQSCITLNKER